MSAMQKVVINKRYGGFGLSDAAYEKLIEWGVPVRRYVEQQRDPETGLYRREPQNDGEVIFDRDLSPSGSINDAMRLLAGRYWDDWIDKARSHPLLVRVVEELGEKANGHCARLEVVGVPAEVEYVVEEYDGMEHVAEAHRTWG